MEKKKYFVFDYQESLLIKPRRQYQDKHPFQPI